MRRAELAANVIILFGPLAVGLAVVDMLTIRSMPIDSAAGACLALLTAGLSLLVFGKLSLFRRGVWVSWGPGQLTASNRRIYFAGYALIATGTALCMLLML